MRIKLAKDKFAELLLYVAKECESDPTFGATKLNKILWFSDILAYRARRSPITNAKYQKLEQGPAPTCLRPVRDHLIADQRLAIKNTFFCGKRQIRVVALKDPDLACFTSDEIACVGEIIRWLWGKTAKEVSDLSHKFLGWKLAKLKEEIPHEVSLVSVDCEPTEDERRYARSLARALATAS